jgi:hypothetical protein
LAFLGKGVIAWLKRKNAVKRSVPKDTQFTRPETQMTAITFYGKETSGAKGMCINYAITLIAKYLFRVILCTDTYI